MIKSKHLLSLVILILIVSACSGTPATSSTAQVEASATEAVSPPVAPTTIPDTPGPIAINAPLVEARALVRIHFVNESDGWGVTATQIIRTNDGGITWYNVTPAEATETGYSAGLFVLDNDHVWLQLSDFNNYPNSGFQYQTSDGGLTWTKSATPFSEGDLTFLDQNKGWMLANLGVGAGSNAVGVFQTNDGGVTWKQTFVNDPNAPNASDSLPLGGIKNGLTPLNMQTAWVTGIVYSDGAVYFYRTDDGGANWVQVSSVSLPPEAEKTQISFSKPVFVTPQAGFMTVTIPADQIKLAVYISHDAGNTWTLTPTLIPGGGSADFVSATDAVIYNGEQFYVTHDAAQTWTANTSDTSFGDNFAMLDFVTASTGWVVTADADDHRSLYRTTDGGMTWSNIIP